MSRILHFFKGWKERIYAKPVSFIDYEHFTNFLLATFCVITGYYIDVWISKGRPGKPEPEVPIQSWVRHLMWKAGSFNLAEVPEVTRQNYLLKNTFEWDRRKGKVSACGVPGVTEYHPEKRPEQEDDNYIIKNTEELRQFSGPFGLFRNE